MRTFGLLPLCAFIIPGALAQPTCGNVQLTLSPDYSFAIGSSSGGSTYMFSAGSQALAQGPMTQLALLHYDNSLTSTSGVAPAQSAGVSFAAGKFGQAVTLAANGTLAYPQGGNLSFQDGTIEMWVSPRYDGSNALYVTAPQVVFQYYWGANGNQLSLAVGNGSSGPYFFGGAAGLFAGSAAAAGISGISGWKAGEWHHLAFTYSVSQSRVRLYVDGQLAQEGDGAINFPSNPSADFTIAGDSFGHASNFAVDEVRITNNEMAAAEIAFDAARSTPFANDEVFLSLAGASPGQLNYSVASCGSTTYNFTGVPITNLSPASGLLPAGSTSVALTFGTLQATTCRYSIGNALDYASMLPLDNGPPTTAHNVSAAGLSTDPRAINQIYIRCASNPDYLQALTYRVIVSPNGPFPRIGNIWNGGVLLSTMPTQAAEVGLFLTNITASQAKSLRAAHPDVLILTSPQGQWGTIYAPINAVPDQYVMKDIHGNQIIPYPGTVLLNMTMPQTAEYVANMLAALLTQDPSFPFDGVFMDSVNLSISDVITLADGSQTQISSNDNGIADNSTTLSAAWRAGVLHEIDTFRRLVPHAYFSCHCDTDPDLIARVNGISMIYLPTDVREGRAPFSELWDTYNTWFGAVAPAIINVEGSMPNQLAYGYGDPNHNMPAAVFEFGRTFFPNMRFGLATTLMNDGFFFQNSGGEGPAENWWYDEYDFNLGYPVAPAAQLGMAPGNLILNGGFESPLTGAWLLNIVNDGQGAGTVSLDSTIAADGNSSAHIAVSSAATAPWHIQLEQDTIPLSQGVNYQVQFWARADAPRTITVQMQGGPPNTTFYGLNTPISIGTTWGLYSATFTSTSTATDGRLEFWVGDVVGNVWLDDVQLSAPAPLYRRDFTNGVVLLNGTSVPQAISSGPGLNRFSGIQAPRYQYIIDDADAGFSESGAWSIVQYDSGVQFEDQPPTNIQEVTGPYFHAWQLKVHELDGPAGTAQWNLNIPEDGQYTLQAWLPAAPNAGTWTKDAIYEVVSNGNVIFSASLDQTTASTGDGWHTIASGLNLTVAGAPFVRVHNGGSGSLIADAVYLTSAALYNDGSPAAQVTLAPFDGILLQRQTPVLQPASRVNSVVNAASYQPAIASGGFVSIVGTAFANSARSWTSSDFSGNNLPASLDGISATINGKQAFVEYISSTQINVIAPDDDTIGLVSVQVTTPNGPSYAGTVMKQKLAPAFFTYPSGTTSYVAAVHQDGTLVGPAGPSSRPAVPGEVIEIYGTGFGATNPASPTSQLISQPEPLSLPATVTIAGVNAQVQWAGIVSSGLYQFNVQIPNVAAGDRPVQTSIGGFQSVANAYIAVAQQ
jgi:uncharacterized protein (TIGR03437 family)